MAVTQDSLRERIRSVLYGAQRQARPYQDVLQSNLTAGGTTVDVLDGTQWAAGDVIDFPDGDQAIVASVNSDTLTLRRDPGATSHAIGDVVWKNPRFAVKQIDYAIDSVIQDLYPDIYKITTDSFVYDPQAQWYPLSTTELMEVISVYYEDHDHLHPRPYQVWRLIRGVDAGEFGEAQGLVLPASGGLHDGDTVFAVYRERITAVTDLLDRQEHLVALGAAYQLMVLDNVARTADPGRWTDRTVQPGQTGRDAQIFYRDFIQMRRREELRLMHEEDRLPKFVRSERARRFRP